MDSRCRTLSGIDAVLHRDQLLLKLDVLLDEPPIGVLKELLEVHDALVAREQLALGDAGLLLERGVLVDELGQETPSDESARAEVSAEGSNWLPTCFCTSASCSRFRSRKAIFFCWFFELAALITVL